MCWDNEEFVVEFYTGTGITDAKCKRIFTKPLKQPDGIVLYPHLTVRGACYAIFLCAHPESFSSLVLKKTPVLLSEYGVEGAICADYALERVKRPRSIRGDTVKDIIALLRRMENKN